MKRICWVFLALIILWSGLATVGLAESEPLLLTVGEAKVIQVTGFTRVATSNPAVIEVVVTGSRELLLNAKGPGLAVVNIWGSAGLNTLKITVQEDYSPVEREIARLINNPEVKVTANAKYVVLEGTVENSLQADQAVQYAKMYRENVLNNLSVRVKYQVLLSVLVTEIRKESQKKYGFSWGNFYQSTDGEWIYDEWNWMLWEEAPSMTEPPFSKVGAVLEAMQKNGDAKILAAPTILMISGKEALFLVGGEIPIPIRDGNEIKVEWKEYGIKLKVTSTIERDNQVAMTVAPEVSSLDWANAVTINDGLLPAISTRKASTSVVFKDGGTLVVGGLLKRDDSVTVYKLPVLGDLPVIGSLFRSKDFQNGRTELLIFLTPKIVKKETDIDPKSITNPPDQGPYYNSNE